MKSIGLKFLSFFLALAMLSSLGCMLLACDSDLPADTSADISDNTTEAPVETEPSMSPILISDLAKYVLIRPDKVSDGLRDKITAFYQRLSNNYGIADYRGDFYKEGVPIYEIGEYEILVGQTNRPETAQFLSELKYNDFGYAQIGNKIVIAGHSDSATMKAMDEFSFMVINNKKPEEGVFYKSEYDYCVKLSYSVESIFIGDTAIEDFAIVYPAKNGNSERIAAEKIAEVIALTSGIVMNVVSDESQASEYEIILGATNRNTADEISAMSSKLGDTESVIKYDGKKINVFGESGTALMSAASELCAKLRSEKTDKHTVTLDSETICKYDDSILTAMSFNVWVSGRSDERDQRVLKMVTDYLPDTIGFQEVNSLWLNVLRSGLKDQYAFVGEGRDGGSKGEYNPIFYKKDIFNLIESGTKWLSGTPDSVSKYAESSLNRIFTYALLERKTDGTKVMVVNTHFDHTSSDARDKQAAVLIKELAKMTEYPIILTGDFNCEASSSAYSTILSSGVKNSRDIADKKINNDYTFTNYGASHKIIDFAFVTPKNISVISYKVCSEEINGDYPSDHHPVLIEYTVVG